MNVSVETFARGIISPEGPAVDHNGNVYLVSRWTGRVMKVTSTGVVSELVHTGGKPQAVTLLESGDLLLADALNQALQQITPNGLLTTVVNSVGGRPFLGPNDLVIGPKNVVFMTDPGMEMETPGQVLRIDLQSKQVTVMVSDLLFPNGITISDDGQFLYVAETPRRQIMRYPLLEDAQRVGPGEVFHEFDEYRPDGIAFDSAGQLLVALCGGGTLAVLSPDGKLAESISVGGVDCTNCVFGGSDFQTLYVTEDKQEALLRIRWPVPGQRRFSRSRC